MLRRMLGLFCCALLVLSPVLGLAGESFTMAGYDGEESTHDWTTNQFFTRMEARTGISFTYAQYVKRSEWQAAKDAMFRSGELPDVLFKASLSTEELIRYTESGQLVDLKPLLAENAPNLWKLLNEHPDWLEAITLPSGKIGALPFLQQSASQNAMWINKAWLDELGLSVPTDMESFKQVLTAFRNQDPNQNGKKDEIPMTFLGPWELKFFSHAWGVVANDYNVYVDDANQVCYWPMEDSFIELAKAMRELFREGLLDKNGFSTADALRRITDTEADVVYGAMFSPSPVNLVPYDAAMDYILLEPFVFEGQQVYRDLATQVTRGTFAITSACEDPAALLRWVDVLYTPEGAIEAMVGAEGVDYEFDAEGYWDWMGGVESMTLEMMNELSIYDTGNMPWLFPEDFYSRYADADVRRLHEAEIRLNELVRRPFPTYTLTTEQTQQVKALQSQLGPYVDEALARFVLGEVEINDETIAAFREGLVQRGAEEMTAFWQGIAQQP